MPLTYEGKDYRKTGCREINDGITFIDEYGESFKVKIYESSKFMNTFHIFKLYLLYYIIDLKYVDSI